MGNMLRMQRHRNKPQNNTVNFNSVCIDYNGMSHPVIDENTFLIIMNMHMDDENYSSSNPLNAIAVNCTYGNANLGHNPNLTHFPMNYLIINGNLILQQCPNLYLIPEYLIVTKDLYLYGCESLLEIPPTIQVLGKLHCDKNLIDAIPNNQLPLYLNFNFYPEYVKSIYQQRLKKG